jgi:hypothetical protein
VAARQPPSPLQLRGDHAAPGRAPPQGLKALMGETGLGTMRGRA